VYVSQLVLGVTETVDSNGVKTIVEHRINEQGQRIKTVRTVKMVKRETKVKKAVLRRRQIPKFGRCLGKPAGPESGVTSFSDLVSLEVPQEEKKVEKKESNLNYTVSCRSCGAVGDHWTMQCPYKDRLMDFDDILAGGDGQQKDEDKNENSLASGRADRYRAPGRARMEGGGSTMPDDRAKEISTTIRVTNLSEDTSEQDVRDLFVRFGNLQRVYLARNKTTQASRGFAFVSFYNRQDAEKALETLQGYGYDNLILRLEFAASSGGAGGSSMRRDDRGRRD
jgi:translation initiation factor 3 subunit G